MTAGGGPCTRAIGAGAAPSARVGLAATTDGEGGRGPRAGAGRAADDQARWGACGYVRGVKLQCKITLLGSLSRQGTSLFEPQRNRVSRFYGNSRFPVRPLPLPVPGLPLRSFSPSGDSGRVEDWGDGTDHVDTDRWTSVDRWYVLLPLSVPGPLDPRESRRRCPDVRRPVFHKRVRKLVLR